MKRKRILALFLAAVSCLSLAVSASAAGTTTRKATDFKDYDRSAWYAEAVSAAVDNGLLYGKSSTTLDPNGDMTRAEMAAIINRSFGCYKTADISQYKDVAKSKWYFEDVAMAVQMGTYNGRSNSSMAPDAPITRQEAMTVVARALELDYDSYSKAELTQFSDAGKVSNWAMPYVRAMVGADYIHGRGKVLAPLDNITRAEFAQIFHNIIGTYVVSKGTYDKDIKGSVLIRTDEVELKNMTVDGDLIIGCGAADGKITLDNVTIKGRLLVWGGGTKAVYCNAGTNMPAVVVARVDDAVKVIYDRDSTLAVIDTIKVRITERAKQHKETEVIFYDVSGLREAQKQLNAIVADNQIALTAPAHLYALVGESSVKAEFVNNSKNDTYKVEIRRNKDNTLIADTFELAAGKSISTLTLLEAPEFGNVDCTVIVTAFRDGKQIGTLNTELTLHTAYLWPKEVQ
ncbi:MAG: S-layer homology domain-containing protein [Faecalibacterium sp.]|nr:S-layer homology domain-containing protein [Faecalibacterium sp.]